MRFRSVTTLRRYLLFQLPGWMTATIVVLLLLQNSVVSERTATILLAAWVGKDFLLYPLLKNAYRKGEGPDDSGIIGSEAIAVDELDPDGMVRVRGELWRAQTEAGAQPITAGDRVRVVAVQGLQLTVREQSTGGPHPSRVP